MWTVPAAILVLVSLTLYSSSFQTWLSRFTSLQLSQISGVTIGVEKVGFRFLKTLVLQGVDVVYEGDTLIEDLDLGISFNDYKFGNGWYEIDEIDCSIAQLNLTRANLDSLKGKMNRGTERKGSFKGIKSNKIKLNIGKLSVLDTLFASQVALELPSLILKSDSLSSPFVVLNAASANGIENIGLKAQDISMNHLQFGISDVELRTKESAGKIKDLYFMKDTLDFGLDILELFVSGTEVAGFIPKQRIPDETGFVQGEFRLSSTTLHAARTKIRFGDYLTLRGDFSVLDFATNNPFFDLSVAELNGSGPELAYVLNALNDDAKSAIERLGFFKGNGFFTGYKTDWQVEGGVSSDIGRVDFDLNLATGTKGVYKGNIKGEELNLGILYDRDWLGPMSFEFDVLGTGLLDIDHLDLELAGRMDKISLSDQEYGNIILEGSGNKKEFEGLISVKDPKLDFDFNGLINFSEKPLFNFGLQLNHWDLPNQQIQMWGLTNMALEASVIGEGKQWGDLYGDVIISSIEVIDTIGQTRKEGGISSHFSSKGGKTNMFFVSDFADFELNGDLNPLEAIDYVANEVKSYAYNGERVVTNGEKGILDLALVTKDPNSLLHHFVPDMDLKPLGSVVAQVNTKDDFASVRVRSELGYQDFAGGVEMDLILDQGKMELDGNLLHVTLGEKDLIKEIDLWVKTVENTQQLTLGVLGANESQQLHISSVGNRDSTGWKYQLSQSTLVLQSQEYALTTDYPIWVSQQGLAMASIQLANKNGELNVEFAQGESISDRFLSIQAEHFAIPEGVEIANQAISGSISGDISLRYRGGKALTDGGVKITKPQFGPLYFDEINLFTGEADSNVVFIDLQDDALKLVDGNFKINGNNKPEGELTVNELPIIIANPYMASILALEAGTLSGNLDWQGTSWVPEGKVLCSGCKLQVNYTRESYVLEDEIVVSPDYIGVNAGKLFDDNGVEASVTATYYPATGSNWSYDVFVDVPRSFRLLDTRDEDDQLFYGTGIGKGTVGVSGNRYENYLDIMAKAESGSHIVFPFYEGRSVATEDGLVSFVSKERSGEEEEERKTSDLILDVEIAADQSTLIEMILDDKTGETIRGRGEGKIRIFTGENKAIEVVGRVEIQSGEYVFTLQNIINKRFSLLSGSSITWFGDPYGAELDMKANYSTRISLSSLIGESDQINTAVRENVNLRLLLSGPLMEPAIDFNFSLPEADDFTRGMVNSIINTKEERTRQAFSILALNQFAPSNQSGNSGFGQGVTSTGDEFLSYGVSSFLNQISNRFVVDFKMRSLLEETGLQNREFDLNLSTRVFNDRLRLSGNLMMEQQNGTLEETSTSQSGQQDFFGEFLVEYALTKDQKFLLKAFNERADRSLINLNRSRFVQGIGVSFRKSFDEFRLYPRKK